MIAEGPSRQQRGAPGQLRVLRYDLLRIAGEDVEIHRAAARRERERVRVRSADVEGRRMIIVEEQPVAGAAQVERNALVAVVRLAREGVVIDHLEPLTALVERGALVAEPVDVLARPQAEARRAPAGPDPPLLDQLRGAR